MKLSSRFAPVILFLCLLATSLAAQDIQLGATFVCNGERIFVQSCNMQDRSDNASCMIGHPDKVNANGLAYHSAASRETAPTACAVVICFAS